MRLQFPKSQWPTSNDVKPFPAAGRTPHTLLFVVRSVTLVVCIGVPALFLSYFVLLALYSRLLGFNHDFVSVTTNPPPPHHPHGPLSPPLFASEPAHHHFPRPHVGLEPHRAPDVSNTFETYLHAKECGLDSRDLHVPISPLCPDKRSVMEAMSSGGRAGYDQAFIPFGCDFRWFISEEICQILDRFSHIFIIGDSLQRMVVTALYMLLREDVGLGGVAEYDFEPSPPGAMDPLEDPRDCGCEMQFSKHECSHAAVKLYSEAVTNSSRPPVCARYPSHLANAGEVPHPPSFDISYHEYSAYPASKEQLNDLVSRLPPTKPDKPYVFIFHHTFWNDVNKTATLAWLDQMSDKLTGHLSFLPQSAPGFRYPLETRGFPRLFVTANAAGVLKNAAYLDTQNSGAIAKFETEIRNDLGLRQIDMLGFFNMSVQTTSSDGTHANMRTNLVKAMMILNWLDWAGREESATWESVGAED